MTLKFVNSARAVDVETLLVVDDTAFHSKFNAFTLATCTIANNKQNFYNNGAHAANKFQHHFGVNFSKPINI